MEVVLNWVQWWGSEVVVLKKRLPVLGYRQMFRTLVLRTCFFWRLFCSLQCHTRLDRVSGLCLRWLGWYLRNAIVVGTFGSGIERMLCVFRLSVNVSSARA